MLGDVPQHPYVVVAGVPVGGLLLATAFSLESSVPLIYPRLKPEGTGPRGIEGGVGAPPAEAVAGR